jgi:hypothetical protein
MAKTTGPMLSLGGSGTIAKTITYSKWKGVPYARQRVIPANPQTTAQTTTRTTFANASNIWKGAPSLFTAPWDRFAVGQPLSGRNAFMKEFVARLRGQADLTAMLFAPSAKGGTPLDSIGLAAGSEQITVTPVSPTPPTGWTLTAIIAAAIVDDDPEDMTDYTLTVVSEASPVTTIVLTGLTPTVLYRVGAWPQWAKPDGSIAYGQSISDSATPTA